MKASSTTKRPPESLQGAAKKAKTMPREANPPKEKVAVDKVDPDDAQSIEKCMGFGNFSSTKVAQPFILPFLHL